MSRFFIFFAVMLLCSCASMDKDECGVADWQAIGYQHGAKGQNTNAFKQYQKDCSKHQIKADFSAFKLGHQQGLDDYCTPERGLTLGRAGQDYNNQCPSRRYENFSDGYSAGLEDYCTYSTGYALGLEGRASNRNCAQREFEDFGTGYSNGYAKFEVHQSIVQLESDLHLIHDSLHILTEKIALAEAHIVSDKSTPETRAQALENIKYFKSERSELGRQYNRLERRLVRFRFQLETM